MDSRPKGRPFVIFDRDGTLIEHIPYLRDPSRVIFKDELVPALKILACAQFALGIVSNQSLVGRKMGSVDDVKAVNEKLRDFLLKGGINLDFVLFCTHIPEQNCKCRKPNIALGLTAIKQYGLDSNFGYMVGDTPSDIDFGINLGITSILVAPKNGMTPKWDAKYQSDSLIEISCWIIQDMKTR